MFLPISFILYSTFGSMSKTKIGVFGALLFGVMMLLIPATSIANAQEYEDRYGKVNDIYYEQDRHYEKDRYNNDYGYGNDRHYEKIQYKDDYRESYEPYKKDNKKADRPVIIIENKIPIPHKDKEKEKDGVLIVKKELFQCFNSKTFDGLCDETGGEPGFGGPISMVQGPDSPLYQDCSDPQVDCRYSVDDFEIDIVRGEKRTSTPDGIEVKLSGKEYFVEEDDVRTDYNVEQSCKISGFDQGGIIGLSAVSEFGVCIIYEGDCSGELHPGDQKECTVKNYLPINFNETNPP